MFHLTITCAEEGNLAKLAKSNPNNYLFLMPKASNDAGFAMTSSFSGMLLAALLIFDQETHLVDKKAYLDQICQAVEHLISSSNRLEKMSQLDIERIVYLGSGPLAALSQEAQLKMLELTAGQIVAVFNSSMGFRHGPKSFINEKTLVMGFLSQNAYTRQYDLDILEEIKSENIAAQILAIGIEGEEQFSGESIVLANSSQLPDAYAA
ncbi:SIS domain protein [Streptococcus ictaluri 707-05]|uniref:SIS domain protein n=1 Tax=Streptococcus ictaluri 707-05 TaxID=764299 RepID=G5K0D2_9STRE|nr:SIS domain protein [Streptococcus ictaluri 707-05]